MQLARITSNHIFTVINIFI